MHGHQSCLSNHELLIRIMPNRMVERRRVVHDNEVLEPMPIFRRHVSQREEVQVIRRDF